MGEVRIKVDEIIGETDDVIRLCKEGGLDLSRIVKTKNKINVPKWALLTFPILFLLCNFGTILIGGNNEKIIVVFNILALAFSFVNMGLIYAKWERLPLLWLSIVAHAILIGVAYGIYSIEDVLNRAEDVINYMKQ